MNKILLTLLLSIVVYLLSGCSLFSKEQHPLLHQQVPYTRYTLMDGSYHALNELKGKKIVLVFWAEWCSYSKPVIERLNKLAYKYKDKKDLVFLAISVDENKNFKEFEERVNYGNLHDLLQGFSGNGFYDEAYLALQGNELPHVFAINDEGVIVDSGHSASVAERAFDL
jgi:thiol-disulfide isomerase/thioredoxin